MNQSKNTKKSPIGKATIKDLLVGITLQMGPIAHLMAQPTQAMLIMKLMKRGIKGMNPKEDERIRGPRQYPRMLIFWRRELSRG